MAQELQTVILSSSLQRVPGLLIGELGASRESVRMIVAGNKRRLRRTVKWDRNKDCIDIHERPFAESSLGLQSYQPFGWIIRRITEQPLPAAHGVISAEKVPASVSKGCLGLPLQMYPCDPSCIKMTSLVVIWQTLKEGDQ